MDLICDDRLDISEMGKFIWQMSDQEFQLFKDNGCKFVEYRSKTCCSLTHGKIYPVLSTEKGFYRIIDNTGERCLAHLNKFRIV